MNKGRKRKAVFVNEMPSSKITHVSSKLTRNFFEVPCYNLARFLLGKILVRQLNDNILKGRIVETECYLGGEDRASHSFGGRQTPGNEPMYMQAGTAYVYMTYGMYFCFNISSIEPGAAVLLRALEPLQGIFKMNTLRGQRCRGSPKSYKVHELCNGPSKLCMSMDIKKDNCNKVDLANSEIMWIEDDLPLEDEFEVVKTSRIGISSAGAEWAKKPLRLYILGNKCVSKRDKNMENELK